MTDIFRWRRLCFLNEWKWFRRWRRGESVALGDLWIAVFVTVYSDLYFQCLYRLLFFRCLHHHLFFLMFTPFSVFSAISTSVFFDVLHHHMLFNVYANFVFFNFIYAPLFFQCLHQHLFLMFTPISFFLMLDQQLFASVSQKSKFSRQYLVCLSLGTNIRLCHRSALSAQTISQSSLNIVSREFFLSYLGGW